MKLSTFSFGIIFFILITYQQKNSSVLNHNFGKKVIETIDSKYWENCETGQGECNPLIFNRKENQAKWFLEMPCGGSFTKIILTKEGDKNPIQTINITYAECPPIFELTKLTDGKYFANMFACGLGGEVEFNLNTLN